MVFGKWVAFFFTALLLASSPAWAADYTIGPGDQLGIEVWKDLALTRVVTVLPDGKISFPLIGELEAGGKTVAQLKKEIEQKIARYVPDSTTTVEVRQSNSLHIYVLGRINAPGRLILNANVNVLQALAIAGGPNTFANRTRIRIFRQEGGKTLSFPFNYNDVTAGKELQMNIELKRGDVIFVP
ncbi:MAG: polysaccharide biosynthesis/export family protein [Deltaproteobacteria bacterium]|nr:polysaccharide biosynthesis/export family protein [Deltaproteobacteria bacterium]